MKVSNPRGIPVRLKALFGADIQVFSTLLFRGWGVIAGVGTTILLPLFLSPTEQGFYYTFTSVLALQVFFELGLNHVLTQLAAHSAAHLKLTPNGRLDGDPRSLRAIHSLLKLSQRWNAVMATLFVAVLLAGGTYFFDSRGTLPVEEWIGAWVALSIATAINLMLSAQLAVCEGIGDIADVARLRLKQSLIGNVILWAFLMLGQGLNSAVAVPLTSAVLTAWWLWRRHSLRGIRLEMARNPYAGSGDYDWFRDIFPLQWKIALSWVSGYIIFSFMTPLVFAIQGPVVAGRLGLALTIFSAISIVGISWVSAKVPVFAAHIARHERPALNALFDQQFWRSITFTIICCLVMVMTLLIVGHFLPQAADRLPTFLSVLMLSVVTLANTMIFAMAIYMRAHKKEPLLAQSLVTALLIGIGISIAAPFSLQAIITVYTFITLFISLPWCALLYANYRYEQS
jgi:hypothetical protein